ncbi:MAG: hypothetical protein ACI4WS_13845 [Oscillospiraceae bacterium]
MRKFYCYSVRLRKALIDHGFTPIGYGVNPRSDTAYWVFEGTKELNDYKDNQYQLDRDNYFKERNYRGETKSGT